jgi:hypothetical protein
MSGYSSYAAARGSPPPGGGTGMPSAAYSSSLLRSVRIEMPSTLLERFEDEIALDLGDGAADEGARYLLGSERGMGDRGDTALLVEARAVRREDGFGTDLHAGRQQHGAMHGVFQFAHIVQCAPRAGQFYAAVLTVCRA